MSSSAIAADSTRAAEPERARKQRFRDGGASGSRAKLPCHEPAARLSPSRSSAHCRESRRLNRPRRRRPALHRHHPHARDGRRPGRELGPSGHADGAGAGAYVLCTRFLKHNPRDPAWPDRDRFVLSAGPRRRCCSTRRCTSPATTCRSSELERFRQWGSKTPGHPEHGRDAPGVETTTGPLGQGFGNGVGMAMAERFLRERFTARTVVDHHMYGIVLRRRPDGGRRLGGGVARRAPRARPARLPLRRQPDHDRRAHRPRVHARTSPARFEAYGWHVAVASTTATTSTRIEAALAEGAAEHDAPDADPSRARSSATPSPGKQGTSRRTASRSARTRCARPRRRSAGIPRPDVPRARRRATRRFRAAVERGARGAGRLARALRRLARRRPEHAAERVGPRLGGRVPAGWDARPAAASTRRRSRRSRRARRAARCWTALAPFAPTMVGGVADLAGSTKTTLPGRGADFTRERAGRNVHLGVREHGMGAAVNGMALHGGIVRPYGSTFLVFSDYMRAADPPLGADATCPVAVGLHPRLDRRSARTARPTSRSSTSRRCARSPT